MTAITTTAAVLVGAELTSMQTLLGYMKGMKVPSRADHPLTAIISGRAVARSIESIGCIFGIPAVAGITVRCFQIERIDELIAIIEEGISAVFPSCIEFMSTSLTVMQTKLACTPVGVWCMQSPIPDYTPQEPATSPRTGIVPVDLLQ
jgi:hypothetical protein